MVSFFCNFLHVLRTETLHILHWILESLFIILPLPLLLLQAQKNPSKTNDESGFIVRKV